MTYSEWRKKKREEEQATLTAQEKAMGGSNNVPSGGMTYSEWRKMKRAEASGESYTPTALATDDIAPVSTDVWFKAGEGDAFTQFAGTYSDAVFGLLKGTFRPIEGITDLVSYGVAGLYDLFGDDQYADVIRQRTQQSWVDDITKQYTPYQLVDPRTGKVIRDRGWQDVHEMADKYSILGDKADAVVEGVGQVGGIILTGAAGTAAGLGAGGVSALTTATTGLSSMGTNMGVAYSEGATDGQAFVYGLTTGAIEAGTELFFGGLGKGVKALGISRGIGGVDDMLAKGLSDKITKLIAKDSVKKVVGNTIEALVKATGEGVEEVLSGLGSAVMKKLTYASDEELKKLVEDEKLLESFVVGAVTSSIAQGSDYVKSLAAKTDFVTGRTASEEKVIQRAAEKEIAQKEANGEKLTKKQKNEIYDRLSEDISRGYISIDTIEEALGGDKYTEYKKASDENATLKKELDELRTLSEYDSLRNMKSGDRTDIQNDRLAELKGKNLSDMTEEQKSRLAELETKYGENTKTLEDMKKQMSDDVLNLVKSERKGQGSLLMESYNEKARRGEGYTVDLNTIDSKKQDTYKRAMDAGILNNTNRTHDFVDLIATLESERGVKIDFVNNQKLKESGFAVDGAIVNGVKTDNGILLNVESAKSLDTVVGHEIAHVLEGTELYQALQDSIIKYAQSKGDYDTRYANIAKLYKTDDDIKIKSELTADLVGDYLFTDEKFIKSLTANPNVFQKVFNEIKYLVKIATSGSEAKRKLLEVQRAFERAWADSKATKNTTNEGGVKYSISESFYKQLDNWDKKTTGFSFIVGDTSEALQKAGLPKKQIRWDATKIVDTLNKHDSGMDISVIRNVPSVLENPIIVVDSKTVEGRKVVLGEVYDKNNKLVVVALELNPTSRSGKTSYTDIIKIASSQGRSHIQSLLDGEIRYVDANKKRVQDWLNANRLQLPLRSTNMNSNYSIPQNSEKSSGLENISATGQFSLSDVSEADKKAHVKTAQEYFGTTYKWDETGYITLDGKRLDFSGKHDGAPGGYRTVDHRDIRDALGLDYGGDGYSDGMIQFMAEGNIRISPEDNGINLSVMPTEAQMQTLDSFITRVRGEVVLDIDDINGNTIFSMEYPRGTYSKKILQDIEARLKKGGDNYVSPLSQFRYSLSNADDIAPVGKYSNLGIQEDIAPVNESVNKNLPIYDVDHTPVVDEAAQLQAQIDTVTAEIGTLDDAMARASTEDEYRAILDKRVKALEQRNALVAQLTALENADKTDRAAYLDSLTDEDAPPEIEAPLSLEDGGIDPLADRDIDDVGSRKVKAYMYENPEVKPFFQKEAAVMLGELKQTTKGERWYNDDLYYETNGEAGFGGTRRKTTADIAYLRDEFDYTYDEIEKGLKAIIEDHGAENNACSKRIEFLINSRLLNGYKSFDAEIPYSQEYRDFVREKQITEYSDEARARFFANADKYAPTSGEDIAPVSVDGADKAAANADTKSKVSPRRALHNGIMDNIKEVFSELGFDFDKVLKRAKNLSTFSTVDNTPQRVMEKALGYKEGGLLADLTVNKVAQNETEGIKWLNSYTDRKNGVLKQISNKYHIKPGSKESAAAQMYAEGFYVAENNDIISYGDAELAKDFPDARVQANIKGLASDPRIRQIYDDTLAMINESRTRNAYPEIPRLDNYFLHFRAMDDTFSKLGLPFNPNDIRAKDLPTDLNGVTADLKPGQPYFASAMHRTGKRTSFDLLGGLERYLNSAKNQIYHIDDIQTLRTLRNYIADTYGQANGLQGLDALSEEEAQERIKEVYGSHLSTFAKFLNEEANILAGKTALIDRGLEGVIGRRGMTFLNELNKQVGSNMVGYNISSSLTNFLPVAQTFAKSNKADFVKAFAQTVAHKISGRSDGFAENSPVMIRRQGADRFYRTTWQKISDPGYALMGAVDSISTEIIARTKYNELVRKGMDSQKAHYETDKWVSRLMGDRSLGQMPQLYNSKMLGLITKFQLEVRNQLDSQFYDTIQEAKVSNEYIENGLAKNAKTAAQVASTFVQLAVVQHLFGTAFESVAGYNPAFDIIEVLMTAFGFDDDEESEDTVGDNLTQALLELAEDLPYASTFLDGGRIPISAALPIEEFVKGQDEWGNEKSRWETLGEIAPYYLLPGGYGQIKKTVQGLNMFSDDHPVAGSYTDSGNLRFPVEDTIGNRIRAGIFGQYANDNARYYFDNDLAPLKENQIQEYIDVGMPIEDYWEYREGLRGLENLSEKADYINSLDLPIEKKNLLINNLTDRKEPIDMTGYDAFGSLEEMDFAVKNPEKYEIAEKVGGYEKYMEYQEAMKGMTLAEKADYVGGLNLTTEQKNALINGETDREEPIDLTGYENYSSFAEFEYAKKNPEQHKWFTKNGISYDDYAKSEDSKYAYNWAYDNPELYKMSKAVTDDVVTYKQYTKAINAIKGIDKNGDGKSDPNTRQEPVINYLKTLGIADGAWKILFRNEFPSDNRYNYDIVKYLEAKEGLTYEEKLEILRSLNMTVDKEGNIYWK